MPGKAVGRGKSLEEAVDKAVHEHGEELGDAARVSVFVEIGHDSPGHIKEWRVELDSA